MNRYTMRVHEEELQQKRFLYIITSCFLWQIKFGMIYLYFREFFK